MKIKEIGKVVTGKTPSTKNSDYFDGNIPFITPEDITNGYIVDKVKRYISNSGYNSIKNNTLNGISVLVGCIGSDMGNVAITDGKCATNQQINAITDISKNINPYYLYYVLSMKKNYFRKIAGTTTTPILPKSVFEEIDIKITSIELQNKIVNILKPIDDKIQNNNKIITELEKLIKTIYDYWFLQYEFPNEENKPYKSSGGKSIYNEVLKREIPENWKVGNCYNNDVYEIIKPGIEYFEDKRYIATGNVDGTNITDGEWIKYETRESRANMQPVNNSIWFAKMKNSIKHITIPEKAKWFLDKYILSTGFLGVKCRENTLSYLHCFIYSEYFEKVKDMLAHGATQEAINNEDLKTIRLIIPDKKVLEKFENYTKSIIQNEFDLVQENQRLTELKEFLLPLLMNGQVNTEDIEI